MCPGCVMTSLQGTDYGDDISALILQVEEDSTIGLGKRKASDSEISDPMSGSNRPVKLRKSNETSNSVDTNEPYIIVRRHVEFVFTVANPF